MPDGTLDEPPRRPRMWVIAGANGSGKSTLYRLMLQGQGIHWINADDIARDLWPEDSEHHAYAAAAIAAERREAAMRAGLDFATETVFSHESKLALLHNARARGYEVTLIYIHLTSVELNIARVAQRGADGGHGVPVDKIAERRVRGLGLLREAIAAADDAVVLDNSSDEAPFMLLARVTGGAVVTRASQLPEEVASALPGE